MKKVFIYDDGSIAYADTFSNTDVEVSAISLDKKEFIPVETREVSDSELKDFSKWDKMSKQKRDSMLNVILNRGKPIMQTRQNNGNRVDNTEIS